MNNTNYSYEVSTGVEVVTRKLFAMFRTIATEKLLRDEYSKNRRSSNTIGTLNLIRRNSKRFSTN